MAVSISVGGEFGWNFKILNDDVAINVGIVDLLVARLTSVSLSLELLLWALG